MKSVLLHDQSGVQGWCEELNMFQKQKKTIQYEQPIVKIINSKQKQIEDHIFNPILQRYSDKVQDEQSDIQKSLKISKELEKYKQPLQKYMKSYDILNFNGQDEQVQQSPAKIPYFQRDFNIINNTNNYLSTMQKTSPKKIENEKQYNIISNIYIKNHEQKYQDEQKEMKQTLFKKFEEGRDYDYDIIKASFNNQEKEQQYQEKQRAQSLYQSKKSTLPLSMVWRESVNFNAPSPEMSFILHKLDQKNLNKKKRYEQKSVIDQSCRDKDILNDEIKFQRLQNRKSDQSKYQKGFDILTLKDNREYLQHIQTFSKKVPTKSLWNQITSTSNIQKDQIQEKKQEESYIDHIDITQTVQQKKLPLQIQEEKVILPSRYLIDENQLREKYSMIPKTYEVLHSHKLKKQSVALKINNSLCPQIPNKINEQIFKIKELNITPIWIDANNRIKSSGFMLNKQ